MGKAKMVNEVLDVVKMLVGPMEKAADAHQLYWDLGGGVSEDDLTSTGLTAVATAAYRVHINKAKVSGQ